jgi:dipicolinate synthase subunit A
MPGSPAGMTVAVVGGDRREQEICRLACRAGAIVRAYGIPWPPSGLAGVARCGTHEEALAGAELCLLPLPLPSSDGALYAPAAAAPIRLQAEHFARLRRSARVIAGSVNQEIIAAAAEAAIPIDTYGAELEGRRDRAVAIAEGAIGRVIAATEHTIRGARVAVLGNGVVGQALADVFRSLGAETWVFGRSPCQPGERLIADLDKWAPTVDILLSTIPAAVLAPEIFRTLPLHALVVDLAAPAGIAPAAESAGARTLRALGLGDCASVTVGGIQWRQILALLNDTPTASNASSA